jgi:hypothetical protein
MKRKELQYQLYVFYLSVILILILHGIAQAQTPDAAGNPRLDGKFTSREEWKNARIQVVNFPAGSEGTWYYQKKKDWKAKSSTNHTAKIKGVTLFAIHDIWSSTTSEDADYNTFELTLWDNSTITLWIFSGEDEPNDAAWIGNSGINKNSFDDRGFLVRLNRDPSTDRHWSPGDPEPGDSNWDGERCHHVFAWAGFNDTGRTVQKDKNNNASGANEVYEIALMNRTGNEAIGVNVHDPTFGNPASPQTPRGSAIARLMEPLFLLLAFIASLIAAYLSRIPFYDALTKRRWHPDEAKSLATMSSVIIPLSVLTASFWKLFRFVPYIGITVLVLWLVAALAMRFVQNRRRNARAVA